MTVTDVETAGECSGDVDGLPGLDVATRMKATSSGITARQRPDATADEPMIAGIPPADVIQSLKRSAMVVGWSLSGKSRIGRTHWNITAA